MLDTDLSKLSLILTNSLPIWLYLCVLSLQLQEYVSGLIEVHGIVQNNNSVLCHNYVVFTPENAEEFGECVSY